LDEIRCDLGDGSTPTELKGTETLDRGYASTFVESDLPSERRLIHALRARLLARAPLGRPATGSSEGRHNDIEVLVLRHQLAVLKRRLVVVRRDRNVAIMTAITTFGWRQLAPAGGNNRSIVAMHKAAVTAYRLGD